MAKISETESIADFRVINSDYVEISQDIPSGTSEQTQGINADLLASFLQILPVRLTRGQVGQNIAFVNLFLVKQPPVWDSKEYGIENFISNKISEITEVEYIFISKEENNFQISIIINKLDRELRNNIYDIEYDILEYFRDMYFDFHVICRDDRDINDLFPKSAIMIYRK